MPDPALERIAVYDAEGRVVGDAARGEVYARSLWHGTAATLLRSTDGRRVYVHRRTDDKLVIAVRARRTRRHPEMAEQQVYGRVTYVTRAGVWIG